ncbi:ABC transporter ATP-binding protein [Biformimicrobium ophioploci]|uniref:ABC transporter ATP-binding protein n=1 Tax=Biformimicrobium ophioploci TaxID=3036711 RepID=A0ABQ6LWJ0_9GAMM|nr:ATP-binding cassette domain-containing protein [Microbulbifer sp. NKW57]GMG86471.1 ABC transporter ATP-binding protein [Microbulbifer sp. NKW57]
MSGLTLASVTKKFGDVPTIKGVDLEVAPGEFVVFVGPSGCGKSTLLRMISGLESVTTGQVHIGGRDVTGLPPSERRIAMVFQSYALYPHMTAEQNLRFGMRMRGVAADVIDSKVAHAVDVLQLQPYLQRKPGELSGGQCQRVAIGRAMVQDPDIFLFDEPLSNLDAELRVKMRAEIADLHRRLGATMIYVTHDQTEALTLADRIVVLNDGVVEQVGAPMALYQNPANRFVAGFIGSPRMNFLAGDVAGVPGAHEIGIRPEHVKLVADGPLQAEVHGVEQLGAMAYLHCRLGDQEVCVQTAGLALPRRGERVQLALPPEHLYAFDRDGRTISEPKAFPDCPVGQVQTATVS